MPWRRSTPNEPTWAAIEAIVTARVGLAGRLPSGQRARLLELTEELLRTRRWEPVGGLALTDEMRVTIAANASFPILSFDTWPYRQVKSIIVRPSAAASGGIRSGPVAGTYTDEIIGTIGEASPNAGPIALSWDAVRFDSARPTLGSNVVIHEFAHKIDMNDGYADGVPPLRGEALEQWRSVLDDEYHRSDARPSDDVLRPYAWTSPAEFFAVATETFFCVPAALAATKPELYTALHNLYQQDPAREWRTDPG